MRSVATLQRRLADEIVDICYSDWARVDHHTTHTAQAVVVAAEEGRMAVADHDYYRLYWAENNDRFDREEDRGDKVESLACCDSLHVSCHCGDYIDMT